VVANKNETVIINGAGTKKDVVKRVAEINTEIALSGSEYEKEKLKERAARIGSGIGVVYVGGDNSNGESELAGKEFFDTDKDFRISEFLHFCSTMLIKEPKETGKAPCMIVFCAFEQQFELIEKAKKYGLNNYINLVFRKNFSAQVLKANMRVVGNCEYGILLYRDKLPKFNNNNRMIFNCFDWEKDTTTAKIHPTQKPVKLLEQLITLFTDPGDVVIDPCAGSGTTLLAAAQCDRRSFGFEIKKNFFKESKEKVLSRIQRKLFN
jgi:site-specific DNA-methyltransferase (adenine-specific)